MGLRIADEWSGVRDYIRWFDVMKLMQEIKKSPQRSFVENRNLFHDLKSEENLGMNIIDRNSFNNYTRRENSGNKQI
jgi:hypothetical protein